jgi:hypothetical protein
LGCTVARFRFQIKTTNCMRGRLARLRCGRGTRKRGARITPHFCCRVWASGLSRWPDLWAQRGSGRRLSLRFPDLGHLCPSFRVRDWLRIGQTSLTPRVARPNVVPHGQAAATPMEPKRWLPQNTKEKGCVQLRRVGIRGSCGSGMARLTLAPNPSPATDFPGRRRMTPWIRLSYLRQN